MAIVAPVYVIAQPQCYIPNSFGMFANETLLHDWRFEQGCCGSGGTHYTTLTDDRLLTRYEECQCCSCCGEPAHRDSSIFLSDIAQLLETTQATCCLATKCCSCCGKSKYLQVRGSFSSQIIYLSSKIISHAKPALVAAIARHKPPNRY